jgi:hypothetical protein
MRGNKKSGIVILLVVALAVGLLGFNTFTGVQGPPSRGNSSSSGQVSCVNPALPVPEEYHIHPILTIVANGAPVAVPANIGLSVQCHRILHTHDLTGTIHVEPNFYEPFTLGQFFDVWGKPFSRDRVLDYQADDRYEIAMTVDGAPSSEFENLVLKDKQQIVIEYREKAR